MRPQRNFKALIPTDPRNVSAQGATLQNTAQHWKTQDVHRKISSTLVVFQIAALLFGLLTDCSLQSRSSRIQLATTLHSEYFWLPQQHQVTAPPAWTQCCLIKVTDHTPRSGPPRVLGPHHLQRRQIRFRPASEGVLVKCLEADAALDVVDPVPFSLQRHGSAHHT